MGSWQNPGIKIPGPQAAHTEVRRAFQQIIQKLGISSNNMVFGQPISTATALRFLATSADKSVVTIALSDRLNDTANQVILTDNSDGTFTLSLPQDIHSGATPTFAGMTVTGFTGVLKAVAGVLTSDADHADLKNITSDQHHAQLHSIASHDDTTATGAELETLTNSSDADALHTHSHANLTGVVADQHIDWTSTTENLETTGDVQAGSAAFGDVAGGDYTEFEIDGSMEFHGDATVWDDKEGDLLSNQRLNPSAHIALDSAEAAVTFKTTCDTGDYVYMKPQIPHQWKLGSSIYPHVHWWQTTAAQPNWLVQYRWQRNGQAKTTVWTDYPLNTNQYTWESGTLIQLTYGAALAPPANYSMSDIIQLRLIRDVANTQGEFVGAESSSVDADALSLDFHYEIDTSGSRAQYTK